MTNKSKLIIGMMAMTITMVLVAGCGSSDKSTAQPPAAQQASGDAKGNDMGNMNMNMPKGDPTPLVKDVDKELQDIVRQVKAGQTMDAQQTAGMLVATTEKIIPHMMNDSLKAKLRSAVTDIKENVNSGKANPESIEGKAKALQDTMKQVTTDLQSMKHN